MRKHYIKVICLRSGVFSKFILGDEYTAIEGNNGIHILYADKEGNPQSYVVQDFCDYLGISKNLLSEPLFQRVEEKVNE